MSIAAASSGWAIFQLLEFDDFASFGARRPGDGRFTISDCSGQLVVEPVEANCDARRIFARSDVTRRDRMGA